jgi:hypothetical protein
MKMPWIEGCGIGHLRVATEEIEKVDELLQNIEGFGIEQIISEFKWLIIETNW